MTNEVEIAFTRWSIFGLEDMLGRGKKPKLNLSTRVCNPSSWTPFIYRDVFLNIPLYLIHHIVFL